MDDDDERSEILRRLIDALIAASDASTVAGMEATINAERPLDLGPDDVILLGFEGSVDHVMRWQRPLPSEIKTPLTTPRRHLIRMDPLATPPYRTTAVYERVGEMLYRRTS